MSIFFHSTQRLSSCVLSSDLVLLTVGSGSCQGFVRLASALAAPAGVKALSTARFMLATILCADQATGKKLRASKDGCDHS